ncbi:hypothetical protein ACEPPN_003106 [Leptodophora sp. 'Broadleaf-Isolate-01']
MANIYVVPYYPKRVKYIIGTGSNHYIGFIDETTVLKYPHFPGELTALHVEREIFERLGKHPRIIEYKGWHEDGVLLEYASNGTLEKHLQEAKLSIREKIRLAKEIAEGVAHAHQQNVLICDIHVRNVLLDNAFCVKLCDFQGRLLDDKGEVMLDGGASENAESFMPRANIEFADTKTDIFALGSTIYHIITGHRPFPQNDTITDEAMFEQLYRNGQFPVLEVKEGGAVIKMCWEGRYEHAGEVANHLLALERTL